jgi:hypothetical protein
MLVREIALVVGELGRMRGDNWSIGWWFINIEQFHILLQNYQGVVSVDQFNSCIILC